MKQNPKSLPDKKNLFYITLLCPALIVYFRSLYFGFSSMDEQWIILKNGAFLERWSSIKETFIYPGNMVYYRPLFMISLILDYHLGKFSPFIYHLSNLIWHFTATVLLFKFLLSFEVPKQTAFFLSLLFSVHPVLLQAVAWVPGRNDIMLSVFFLSSLVCLKNYSDYFKAKDLWLHIILHICALFTKESAIIFPVIFFAVLLFSEKITHKKKLVPLITWVFVSLLWLCIRNSVIEGYMPSNTSVLVNLKNFALGFILFVGKTIYPVQQSVLPTLKNSSLVPGIFTLILLVILGFSFGVKNKKTASLGLLIFIILLLLPLWFGATKAGNEHYEQRIYGSMSGLILFLTQIKVNTSSKFLRCALILLFVGYVFKTSRRMSVYKNELSYIDAGIMESPDYYLFYVQKADMLSQKGQYDSSIPFYKKALELRPNHWETLSNRGTAYYHTGRYKEALTDYNLAIKNSQFNELYYINRCNTHMKLGDIEKAMADLIILKKCCGRIVKPELEKNIIDQWLLIMNGYQDQLSANPNNPALYYKMATLYFNIQMNENGCHFLTEACKLNPGNEEYKKVFLSKCASN